MEKKLNKLNRKKINDINLKFGLIKNYKILKYASVIGSK
jgi:hypothetical protein